MATKKYWQEEKPTEDGLYEVYLGNDYYETRYFFNGDWTPSWNPNFKNAEVVASHKIQIYKTTK